MDTSGSYQAALEALTNTREREYQLGVAYGGEPARERHALNFALAAIVVQAERLPRRSSARRALAEAAKPIRDALDTLP